MLLQRLGGIDVTEGRSLQLLRMKRFRGHLPSPPWLQLLLVGAIIPAGKCHPRCPCLEELPEVNPVLALYLNASGVTNVSAYGLGCAKHDAETLECSDAEACFNTSSFLPLQAYPSLCDKSWCQKEWCYVDITNCDLLTGYSNRIEELDGGDGPRWFSYAACGDLDRLFSDISLERSLQGKTFQVGFLSNTGGWTGAYSRTKQNFRGPGSQWYGPVVELVKDAARLGNFDIKLTAPPEHLRNKSREFFGESSFDYCIFAAATGYLDFCAAAFTMTDRRVLSGADWYIIDDHSPIHLVTMTEEKYINDISVFTQKFMLVFKPFSGMTWLLLFLGFLPFLALTMMLQELGVEGSDYPLKEKKEAEDNLGDLPPSTSTVETRYPMRKNVNRAFYLTLLSFLRRMYPRRVISYGGSWTLLGFSFLGMIGMSIYTAGMTAFLTAGVPKVTTMEEAMARGYTFCT